MYYPDLTPYEYGMTEHKDALNIGWLEIGYEFSKEDFPEKQEVIRKLKIKKIENKYRGFHSCEFCYPDDKYVNKFNPSLITKTDPEPFREWYNGNGEYITQWGGKTYASPILIVHYIEYHNYKPPQEFINAVINEK